MSSEREADRALKRQVDPVTLSYLSLNMADSLRTRMAFVQTSEEKLGEKEAHCPFFPTNPTHQWTFADLADRLEGCQRIS